MTEAEVTFGIRNQFFSNALRSVLISVEKIPELGGEESFRTNNFLIRNYYSNRVELNSFLPPARASSA